MSDEDANIRVMPTTVQHTGTVIFMHGSGDTGMGVKEWVKMLLKEDMKFPHIKVLYPTAPFRPYTPLGGENSNVWFDRRRIAPDVPEHLETINLSLNRLTEIVNEEVKSGIEMKNIIIGGFSMGGAMALHLGYRALNEVGGIFALSSFLNDDSIVYKTLDKRADRKPLPPLFMCHGDRDELVLLKWGQETFGMLEERGIKGEFHVLNGAFHELKRREILQLRNWISERIPSPSEEK